MAVTSRVEQANAHMATLDPWHCFYCKSLLTKATRSKDHILPKAHGGLLYDIPLGVLGYRWACKACNELRGRLGHSPVALLVYLELGAIQQRRSQAARQAARQAFKATAPKLGDILGPLLEAKRAREQGTSLEHRTGEGASLERRTGEGWAASRHGALQQAGTCTGGGRCAAPGEPPSTAPNA